MTRTTVPPALSDGRLRRARALRRLFIAGVVALLVLSLAGLAGPRVATVRAEADGWVLEVEYPQRTRGGLPADLRILVSHAGGFQGPITLALSVDYLTILQGHDLWPQPSGSTADESWLHLDFDPPTGTTFAARYSARTTAALRRGADGVIAVLVGGVPVVSVPMTTVILP